ncbi:MAG: hypothetical protein WC748_08795 [Legionellales bacterium]|jgi:hypothetical protein
MFRKYKLSDLINSAGIQQPPLQNNNAAQRVNLNPHNDTELMHLIRNKKSEQEILEWINKPSNKNAVPNQINFRNNEGKTALYLAVENGYSFKVQEAIIKNGGDIYKVAHLAAGNHNVEMLKALFKITINNQKLSSIVIQNWELPLVDCLLFDVVKSETNSENITATLQLLFANGANALSRRPQDKKTALIVATEKRNMPAITHLIRDKRPEHINAVDTNNKSAIFYVCDLKAGGVKLRDEIALLFLENNADISICSNYHKRPYEYMEAPPSVVEAAKNLANNNAAAEVTPYVNNAQLPHQNLAQEQQKLLEIANLLGNVKELLKDLVIKRERIVIDLHDIDEALEAQRSTLVNQEIALQNQQALVGTLQGQLLPNSSVAALEAQLWNSITQVDRKRTFNAMTSEDNDDDDANNNNVNKRYN